VAASTVGGHAHPGPSYTTLLDSTSDMRAYERNSVIIDQCTGCRGIFLDRGELERLVDGESAYYDSPRQPSAPSRGDEGYGGYGKGHHDQQYGSGHGAKGRRRQGFLGDLFG